MERDFLSCKDFSSHSDKWILLTANEEVKALPCFACCILSLEDEECLNLRKKCILSCFCDILESNQQILISVIIDDDQVIMHTAQVLLRLLNSNDEGLSKLAGECLLLFLIHMKKEELSLAVSQKLTFEVSDECNYIQRLPHFRVLGRLFQIFPELVQPAQCDKCKFLHVLAGGLNYPADNVKSTILFLLREIYHNASKQETARALDVAFGKSTLRIIKGSQDKHLIKNALGFLEVLIYKVPHSLNSLFETATDEVSFIHVIRKMVMSSESAFQVSIVQCICKLLSKQPNEKYIKRLLEANILEIFLESLSVKNELLLESILCCLLLFVQHSADVTKSRFIFGVGIIADVALSLLSDRNWRLLCITLKLLTSLISCNKYLVISTQITFFLQSMQLSENAFKVSNPTVLLETCKFFTELLKNESLPWPFPMQQICNNMFLCLKAQSKFITSWTVSDTIKNHTKTSDSLPIELKMLISSLGLVHSCLRIYKKYVINPVSLESGFIQPINEPLTVSKSSQTNKKSEHLLLVCISSIDEIFIPYCLKLKSTDFGRLVWYHLIRLLSLVFEELSDSILLYNLSRKLIKAGIFKHLFEMKFSYMPFNECDSKEIQTACNNCVHRLLKCCMKNQVYTDTYLTVLQDGIYNLNDTLENCASVLSQRVETNNTVHSEFGVSSSQIAFLCICYICYLNEAFIVSVKGLAPHLIYFVTCNCDLLSFSTSVLKHLIFLMAVCTFECIQKNSKSVTSLMEANMIIWDLLPKLKSPLQVYTHHKYMLWWCFRNECINSFSSTVLLSWITFCITEKNDFGFFAMKTVTHLLCSNSTARQTFAGLFDVSSSSNNETLIIFLKDAIKMQIFTTLFQKNFLDLIGLMIEHLHAFLIKIFIMKNEKDSNDKILCQGLDCLLWCYKHINICEIDSKIIFHVSRCCFSSESNNSEVTSAYLQFLHFIIQKDKQCEKAWHVITGDLNFSSFFKKCFSCHSSLEVQALSLLTALFICQINYDIKSNKSIIISSIQILKWLTRTKTQSLAYQIFNCFIRSEFKENLIICLFTNYEETSNSSQLFLYFRLFSLYLQNAIISKNPFLQKDGVKMYLKFLSKISEIDKSLENHIMLQPWGKVLLESRLEVMNSDTWELFGQWLNYQEVNISIIGVMQQFAIKVQSLDDLTATQKNCIHELCTGVYANYIPKETREVLQHLSSATPEVVENKNLVSQVESLVHNYLSNER